MSSHLKCKFFETWCISVGAALKIIVCLVFFESEKQQAIPVLIYGVPDGFNSTFADDVRDGEWNGTKDQTKKKY